MTLFNETQPIPLHAIMAMIAIILGGIQLSMKKGGVIHKLLGRIWIGIMMFVAITSFFIHEINLWGAYSPIHLLSLWTIFILGVFRNVDAPFKYKNPSKNFKQKNNIY